MTPTILIAGIGNIFLGDDGFGSEVARRLMDRSWPDGVRVVDYGIRGFDVAFALMDDVDVSILIDATPQGGSPGMLYIIEPELSELNDPAVQELPVDTHAMNPMKVFQLVRAMDGRFKKVLIVGCEPADFGPENEGRLGLSPPVAAAVDEAVRLIDRLVTEILAEPPITSSPFRVSASPRLRVSPLRPTRFRDELTMCLAIPGQITELLDDHHSLAMVDILGVRRKVSIDLLLDDPPTVGDWVLVHVGFAMSKISDERAAEQLEMLALLGEATAAREELALDTPDPEAFPVPDPPHDSTSSSVATNN